MSNNNINYGGYDGLACMIVVQAMDDYIHGIISEEDYIRFAYSDEFILLSNMDSDFFVAVGQYKRKAYKEWKKLYEKIARNSKRKAKEFDGS